VDRAGGQTTGSLSDQESELLRLSPRFKSVLEPFASKTANHVSTEPLPASERFFKELQNGAHNFYRRPKTKLAKLLTRPLAAFSSYTAQSCSSSPVSSVLDVSCGTWRTQSEFP
jgi:hypothetical protein